jgi:hypothetical protein
MNSAEVSLALGNINMNGRFGGRAQIVSVDTGYGLVSLGDISGRASGASGVGTSVGIFALGAVTLGDVDLANNTATIDGAARGGDLFISSDTSIDAGKLTTLGSNGSRSGWLILVNTKNKVTTDTLTVNLADYGQFASHTNYQPYWSTSGVTTIRVSPRGLINYNPHGFAYINKPTVTATLEFSGDGNPYLVAPIVSLSSINVQNLYALADVNSGSLVQYYVPAAASVSLVSRSNITIRGDLSAVGPEVGGSVSLTSLAGNVLNEYLSLKTTG